MHWSLPEVQLRKLRVSLRKIIPLYIAISSKTDVPLVSVSPFSRNCTSCSHDGLSLRWWRAEEKIKERVKKESETEENDLKCPRRNPKENYEVSFVPLIIRKPSFVVLTSVLRRIKMRMLQGQPRNAPCRILLQGTAFGTQKVKERGESVTIKCHCNIARYILHGPIPFCLWSLRILNCW